MSEKKIHPATIVLIRELRRQGSVKNITTEIAMKMTLERLNEYVEEMSGAEIAEIVSDGDHR